MDVLAANVQTGDPIIDSVLQYGLPGLIFVIAFLILRYMYQEREKTQSKADVDRAAAHKVREDDWADQKATWEKERTDLFAFRDMSRKEWDKERDELITQRNKADERADEYRKTAERATDGVRAFMEVAQKEAMAALKESQAALGEAATRERVQSDRIASLEREIDLMRRLQIEKRGQSDGA